MLQLWAEVMLAVPRSQLLLLCPQGEARRRVCRVLGERGIAGERIEFLRVSAAGRVSENLPSHRYWPRHVSLQWPHDKPRFVVDGRTGNHAGRQHGRRPAGWCQLGNLGMHEWAAATPSDFVAIAVARRRCERVERISPQPAAANAAIPAHGCPAPYAESEAAFRKIVDARSPSTPSASKARRLSINVRSARPRSDRRCRRRRC